MPGTATVLVVGGGGREHALAVACARPGRRVVLSPGNAAAAADPRVEVVAGPGPVELAAAIGAGLVLVGPEAPLVAGLADELAAAGVAAFGPGAAAAQLEGSKVFSKEFCWRHGIPTGEAAVFSDYAAAAAHVRSLDAAPVIKADGLAAGKGVIVPETAEEALAALHAMLVEERFGAAGRRVLVERRLSGPEVSVLAFCDGERFRVLPPARDHKRLGDGDVGPNTGGMGAYAPAPLPAGLLEEVGAAVLAPTLAGMAAEGAPYRGVLYAGLMLTAEGPCVLEFNCRLGDPETQAVLPLLEEDVVELAEACAAGRLGDTGEGPVRTRAGAAVTVVMAAAGYPDSPRAGAPITGIDKAQALGCEVYGAGVAAGADGELLTAGGRVLAVTGLGADLAAAAELAYRGVDQIHFEGAQWRTDISR